MAGQMDVAFGHSSHDGRWEEKSCYSCAGQISLLTSVYFVGIFSLIFAVLETGQVIWFIALVLNNPDDFDKLRQKFLLCSFTLLIGLLLRIFSLIYWLILVKRFNSKANRATTLCIAFSSLAIILFVCIIVFQEHWKNKHEDRLDRLGEKAASAKYDIPSIFPAIVDLIFAVVYAIWVIQYFLRETRASEGRATEMNARDWANKDNDKYKRPMAAEDDEDI